MKKIFIMFKKILLIIIFSGSFVSIFSQDFPYFVYKTDVAKLDSANSYNEFWGFCGTTNKNYLPENQHNGIETKYYFKYDSEDRLVELSEKYYSYSTITKYYYENDKISEIIQTYDDNINLKEYTYSADSNYYFTTNYYNSTPNYRVYYYYDDNDSLTKEIWKFYQIDQWNTTRKSEFLYTDNSYIRMSYSIDYETNKLSLFGKYTENYNSFEKIINSINISYYYTSSEQIDSSFVTKNYEYDKQNRLISEIINYSYDYVSATNSSILYEYSNNKVTEYYCYGSDTIFVKVYSVQDDKILNLSHYTSTNFDTLLYYSENIYDKYSNLCRTADYFNFDNNNSLHLSHYFDFYWDTYKIDTNPLSKIFTIYPNPVSNMLFIKYEGVSEILNYNIYSADGKIVKQGNSKTDRIDISDIPIGIYIIDIQNFNYSQKFLKIY